VSQSLSGPATTGPTIPSAAPDPVSTPVAVRQIAEGFASDVLHEDRRVAQTDAEWSDLWARHAPVARSVLANETRETSRTRPDVDLARERVVAAFAGQTKTCQRVEIARAADYPTSGVVVVTVATYDATGCPEGARPYAIAAIPLGAPVVFREEKGEGSAPGVLDDAPCGAVDIFLDRDAIRPGELLNVTGRFTPCENEAPRLTPGCWGDLVTGFVGGSYLANGSALPGGPLCNEPAPPVQLAAGRVLEHHWTWNATQQGSSMCFALRQCIVEDYPAFAPGAVPLRARAQSGAWTLSATRNVLVLPERRELPVLRVDETLEGASSAPACGESTLPPDGVPTVSLGSLAVLERNLTTAGGNATTWIGISAQETTLRADDGSTLYGVSWNGTAFLVDGKPASTHDTRIADGADVVHDAARFREEGTRLVELAYGGCGYFVTY